MKTEEDYYFFRHKKFPCVIKRVQHSGHLCGYVGVKADHPLYKKQYHDYVISDNVDNVAFNGNYIALLCNSFNPDRKDNEISLDLLMVVHGGLTWSEDFAPGPGDDKTELPDTWWFGFDCAHSGDFCPKSPYDGGVYRDVTYVKKEIYSLVHQLIKLKQ